MEKYRLWLIAGPSVICRISAPVSASRVSVISTGQVRRLEGEIDELNARLAPLTSFILPGGTSASAHLHVARAIVRRAEVELSALAAHAVVRNELLAYVNRLSDHLFVLARTEAARAGGDVLWVPGANQ